MVNELNNEFDSLTDEQLVQVAKNDDNEALSLVVKRYSQLAHDLSQSFSTKTSSSEDYFQESLLALISAVFSYKSDKGASFKTYAVTCMKNRLIDIYRRESREFSDLPLEKIEQMPSNTNVQDDFETRQRLESVAHGMMIYLSDDEREAISLTLDGFSVAEIAEKQKKSAKSVSNALFRARKKLKQSAEG